MPKAGVRNRYFRPTVRRRPPEGGGSDSERNGGRSREMEVDQQGRKWLSNTCEGSYIGDREGDREGTYIRESRVHKRKVRRDSTMLIGERPPRSSLRFALLSRSFGHFLVPSFQCCGPTILPCTQRMWKLDRIWKRFHCGSHDDHAVHVLALYCFSNPCDFRCS